MVTKAEEKAPRVQISMTSLIDTILGTGAGSKLSTDGVQVIHVLKNGTVKITYNDSRTFHIPPK